MESLGFVNVKSQPTMPLDTLYKAGKSVENIYQSAYFYPYYQQQFVAPALPNYYSQNLPVFAGAFPYPGPATPLAFSTDLSAVLPQGTDPSLVVKTTKRKLEQIVQTPLKKVKNGRRVCMVDDCTKFAQGGTHKCISHGGGKRCRKEGCAKSAYGTTKFCISHGGGKRCCFPGCNKSSQGSTNKCKAHGGGRRCKREGCKKSAQGSSFCKAHGGGKRCVVVGCTKLARGKPYFSCCVTHGRRMMQGEKLVTQP